MKKHYKHISVYLLLCFLTSNFLMFAQSPKREMRASWLTTVWRIDWPSVTVPAKGSESQRAAAIKRQKNEFIAILDKLQQANMNAVFFQIRSMSDAMYPSSYENWSSFISSERGADPGYDPLEFAIEEAHKRGIELHAWLNPYRYSSSQSTHGNLPTDYANSHPDWLIVYDSYTKILNPGRPEVIQRITDIIEEVVTNYDVDGIVFDDYFYGNGATTNAMDQEEYDLYNPNGLSRADWRRENCNKMIASVYQKIQEIKPYVTFGVSPAGIAASSPQVAEQYGVVPAPVGSDWQYNGIYSDPLAWLKQGSLDYISPQIYWTTTSKYSYAKLAPWWSVVANKFGKHFYSSHSLSAMSGPANTAQRISKEKIKVGNELVAPNALTGIERSAFLQKSTMMKAPAAMNYLFPELGKQVNWNRKSNLDDAPGSVFFATKKTVDNRFLTYLRDEVFTSPALVPAIAWKSAENQELVSNLFLSLNTLSWSYSKDNVRYAIYAVPMANRNDENAYSSSLYLQGVSYSKEFKLPANISTATHKIAVSVLDRYGNEYAPRILGEVMTTAAPAQLEYPANNSQVVIPTVFKWTPVDNAISYVWEVATDSNFKNLVCAREVIENQFFSGLISTIKNNVNYYWRVRARVVNAPDSYSDTFQFRGEKFKITSPIHGTTNVQVTPTFTWMDISATATYKLEISTSSTFETSSIIFESTTDKTTLKVPENVLLSETNYYARVTVTDTDFQATSETTSFRTQELEIPIPTISSPVNNEEVFGNEIQVTWSHQPSKNFRVELSNNPAFPPRTLKIQTVDAFTYNVVYTDLPAGTYYIRVKALTNNGYTEPSETVVVNLKDDTGLNDDVDLSTKCYIYYDRNEERKLMISALTSPYAWVEVYSSSGLLIRKDKYQLGGTQNVINFNFDTYPQGIYIIKVTTNEYERTIKVSR